MPCAMASEPAGGVAGKADVGGRGQAQTGQEIARRAEVVHIRQATADSRRVAESERGATGLETCVERPYSPDEL